MLCHLIRTLGTTSMSYDPCPTKPAAPSEADTEETDDDDQLQGKPLHIPCDSKLCTSPLANKKTLTSDFDKGKRRRHSPAGSVPAPPYMSTTHHRFWTAVVLTSGSPSKLVGDAKQSSLFHLLLCAESRVLIPSTGYQRPNVANETTNDESPTSRICSRRA